ncbi:hypothetical protein CYMTET_6071 [Cymbomonas tetramitiformis]|uniref:Uncharacterized protein n=1 Tax=Cymbomonas tetramitiformis TaxID=36881 RepID=A0AAE0LIV5_9CHLO|nr:hypothetical protein CYMTET_6071 [Cymbomonas tetramitiformis]
MAMLLAGALNPYTVYNGSHKLNVHNRFAESGAPAENGAPPYSSCAVVGNAGHLISARHGTWIDRHELVMRFNRQVIKGYERHVGTRTTHRVLNLSDGMAACCRRVLAETRVEYEKQKRWPTLVFWHPSIQDDIMMKCRKKFPSLTHGLSETYIRTQVRWFKALRKDLLRLGMGPFGDWRQMTSGAHGILMAVGMCESISMYGFTTYPMSSRGKDQYAGNTRRKSSGNLWHDWKETQQQCAGRTAAEGLSSGGRDEPASGTRRQCAGGADAEGLGWLSEAQGVPFFTSAMASRLLESMEDVRREVEHLGTVGGQGRGTAEARSGGARAGIGGLSQAASSVEDILDEWDDLLSPGPGSGVWTQEQSGASPEQAMALAEGGVATLMGASRRVAGLLGGIDGMGGTDEDDGGDVGRRKSVTDAQVWMRATQFIILSPLGQRLGILAVAWRHNSSAQAGRTAAEGLSSGGRDEPASGTRQQCAGGADAEGLGWLSEA